MARYHGKMLRIALRRLDNHADAEEIAQDTLIRAHRGLAAFRGDSSLAVWLYRIAVNLSCNRHGYFFRRGWHRTLSLRAAVDRAHPELRNQCLAAAAFEPARFSTDWEFACA